MERPVTTEDVYITVDSHAAGLSTVGRVELELSKEVNFTTNRVDVAETAEARSVMSDPKNYSTESIESHMSTKTNPDKENSELIENTDMQ